VSGLVRLKLSTKAHLVRGSQEFPKPLRSENRNNGRPRGSAFGIKLTLLVFFISVWNAAALKAARRCAYHLVSAPRPRVASAARFVKQSIFHCSRRNYYKNITDMCWQPAVRTSHKPSRVSSVTTWEEIVLEKTTPSEILPILSFASFLAFVLCRSCSAFFWRCWRLVAHFPSTKICLAPGDRATARRPILLQWAPSLYNDGVRFFALRESCLPVERVADCAGVGGVDRRVRLKTPIVTLIGKHRHF